jgi:hypothetical protein
MTDPSLTPFQIEAEAAIVAVLERGDRRVEREVLHGTVPFLAREPVTILRLTSGKVTCWVDDTVLDFKNGDEGVHLERPDYPSSGELLRDFLDRLRRSVTA